MPALQRACERDRGAEGALPATGAAGELHDAYAVTEANAGSDPSRIETTARRTDGGWVINGEKWFVTYGDIAAVYIVVANALVDGERLSTLFLVDAGADGIEVVDDPVHAHVSARPSRDPVHRRRGSDDAIVGGLGNGDQLQRAWFTEERLGIAARGVGSMWRLLEEATAWALEREQAARGSSTTRACRSRSPTPPPTPRPGAC